MASSNPHDFDIDVDVSTLYEHAGEPVLVSSRWYELNYPRRLRTPEVMHSLAQGLRNAHLAAQWQASGRRTLDRRRALRVPLISRVLPHRGKHMTACDISLSGLRCSGEPTAPVMDVEFKLPNAAFPIDARVEVVSYKESNVVPLLGLRFCKIERPYIDIIADYIRERRARLLAA